MALTARQQAFVEAYAGNAAEAARVAGYTGNANTLKSIGAENMTKPDIIAAIEARNAGPRKQRIASREERQAFWTRTLEDAKLSMSDRLRASELLGKSEADFIERTEHSGGISVAVVNPYSKPEGT